MPVYHLHALGRYRGTRATPKLLRMRNVEARDPEAARTVFRGYFATWEIVGAINVWTDAAGLYPAADERATPS